MNCKKIKENIIEYLNGEIDKKNTPQFKSHISSCDKCQQEFENIKHIWTGLKKIPQVKPDKSLNRRFYAMLEEYQQETYNRKKDKKTGTLFSKITSGLFALKPVSQLMIALFFLVFGFGLGYFMSSPEKVTTEMTDLRHEVDNLRQDMTLVMLNQNSASDRLSGVSQSVKIKNPDKNILRTLLETLNNDPNINVRLAVIDSLYLFADHPLIRRGIVHALSLQNAPIIQVALIDLIVAIREKQAIKALKTLINQRYFIPEVKQHAEFSLQKLVQQNEKSEKKNENL